MARSTCAVCAVVLVLSLTQTAVSQTTRYVDASATLGGDTGADWPNAYLDLQSALAVAVSGDEIRVAAGTYYPTSGSDRTISFNLVAGVDLLGGYPAGGGTRDWDANETILSGDIGSLGVDTDNSQHVLVGADNMTLDGFTITKGYWDSNVAGPREGAGLYISGALYPSILNCRFVDNHSWYRGAGIYFGYGANSTVGPLISNCYFSLNTTTYSSAQGAAIHAYHRVPITIVDTVFENNTSTSQGAAIWSQYNDLIISNCVFRGNTSQSTGGAIWHSRQDLTSLTPSVVVDSDFYENTSTAGYGGAIYWARAYNTTDVFRDNKFYANVAVLGGAMQLYTCGGVMESCVFSGNRTTSNTGGALDVQYSAMTFRNLILVGNNSGHRGGAIMYQNSNGPSGGVKLFENVLAAGNKCVYDGGAICVYNGGGPTYPFHFVNCTIVSNKTSQASAAYGGGGLYLRYGTFAITNTLVYGNDATSGSGEQIYVSHASSPTQLGYNDLAGDLAAIYNPNSAPITDNGNNIDIDPEFVPVASGTWSANSVYTTSSGETELTDTTQSWAVNELAGKFLAPDTTDVFMYYIISNSATTVTVLGDATDGVITDPYRIDDFKPVIDSPLVEAGVDGGAATDIEGTGRPQGTFHDIGAYEYEFDAIAPADVTGLAATPAFQQVTLVWTNPVDTDFAGVLILRKGDSVPTGIPTDTNTYTVGQTIGNGTVVLYGIGSSGTPGAESTWTDTGLENGSNYFYKVFARDEKPNYSTGESTNGVPESDSVAPDNVNSLSATAQDHAIRLDWTNPGDGDFQGVLILRRAGGTAPSGSPNDGESYLVNDTIGDGTVVFVGAVGAASAAASWTNTSLGNDETYSYKVFSYDLAPNYPSGQSASETTLNDGAPPLAVSAVSASPDDAQITLQWQNPFAADFAGVLILRRVDGAPSGSPTDTNTYAVGDVIGDGVVVFVGTGSDGDPGDVSTWTDTSLTNAVHYYYEIFALDEVPNYATSAGADATPFLKDIVFVNPAQTAGANNGSSWDDAYVTLTNALARTSAPTNIWVAAGTYKPGAARTDAFVLQANVAVYGGFTNDTTTFNDRAPDTHVTTLSGDIDGNQILDSGNSYHVVVGNDGSRLDGFTVTYGYADAASGDDSEGGGLFIEDPNGSTVWIMTVANCTFSRNAAYTRGGAIHFRHASAGSTGSTVSNCLFESNYTFHPTSSHGGGAIAAYHHRILTVQDSVFRWNRAGPTGVQQGNGGGIYADLVALQVSGCTFHNNRANAYGGGIYENASQNTCSFSDNVFYANKSTVHGAGMYLQRSYQAGDDVTRCQFYANESTTYASALYLSSYDGSIEDCLFSGNECANTGNGNGAGMYLYASSPTVRDVIVAGGNTGNYGGAIYVTHALSMPVFNNLLLVGNRAKSGGGIYFDATQGTLVNCTIITNFAYNAANLYGGGAIHQDNGTVNLRNSIFWHNGAAQEGDNVYQRNASAVMNVDFCAHPGGVAGIHNEQAGTINDDGGNITDDPALPDPVEGAWSANGSYNTNSGLTILTDSGADFVEGGLAGQFVNPDTSDYLAYYIISNTPTTITVLGDASAGDILDAYAVIDAEPRGISDCIDAGTAGLAPDADLVGVSRPQPVAGSFDMGVYEFEFDSQAPADVTGLAAADQYQQIVLSWTNPVDSDFEGVLILRKVGSAPTGAPVDTNTYATGEAIGDGTVVYRGPASDGTPGAAASYTDTGLTTGINYFYAIHAYDEKPNYSGGAGTNGVPVPDVVAPDDVTGLAAVGGDQKIVLSWTNSVSSDQQGVLIVRRSGAVAPTGVPATATVYTNGQVLGDGSVVFVGNAGATGAAASWTNTNLGNIDTYSYKIFAYDLAPNYPSGVSASATTLGDGAPPADINTLVTTAGDTEIAFSWLNPSDADFAGVLILRKVGSAPGGTPVHTNSYTSGDTLGDGTVVYVGSGNDGDPGALSGYTDTGLTNGITYYYKIFAFDEVPNYAPGVADSGTPQTPSNIIYVDWNAPGPGEDGTSWETAFTNLTDALAIVKGGTNIWVAQGTYKPGPDRDDTFMLVNDVGVYGGFTNDMDSISQRDPDAYVTTLSGDIDGDDLLDDDNVLHVVTATWATNVVFDGFTVTMGYAWGAGDVAQLRDGGGFFLYQNNNVFPTINNCRFVRNAANYSGGAVTLWYSSAGAIGPVISNCTFEANYVFRSGARGGALFLDHQRPFTVVDCTFQDNTNQLGTGGALWIEHGGLDMDNCVFRNNVASSGSGGAVYTTGTRGVANHTHNIRNSIFAANYSGSQGGGIFMTGEYNPDDVISNCQIYDNTATHSGAGIFAANVSGTIEDCIISGNEGGNSAGGAGIYSDAGDPTIARTRIVGNGSASTAGGGLRIANAVSDPVLENVLVAGNRSRYGGAGMQIDTASSVGLRNCTFADNVAFTSHSSYGGGGISVNGSGVSVTIRNTIIYGNSTDGLGSQMAAFAGTTIGFFTSDVEEGTNDIYRVGSPSITWSAGNITNDPAFVGGDTGNWTAAPVHDAVDGTTVLTDSGQTWTPGTLVGLLVEASTPTGRIYYVSANSATTLTVLGDASQGGSGVGYQLHDYQLGATSEAIDSGSAVAAPDEDIDSTARPQGAGYDMGVYESVPDGTAPGPVTGLAAVGGQAQVALTWTNPVDSDFTGVLIVRKTGSAPGGTPTDTNTYTVGEAVGDGVVVYTGAGSDVTPGAANGWTDTDLEDTTAYYYQVFAYDGVPNHSTPATANATTDADSTAPSDVDNLAAAPQDTRVVLTWDNPPEVDLAGILIVRRIDNDPTGVPSTGVTYTNSETLGDGIVVYAGPAADITPGAANVFTNTGLENGTTYHYKVFAYDEIPNYSAGVTVDETPLPQGVLYVAWMADGDDDGTSWPNAYTNLQDALAAAVAGNQIWIAEGTYIPGGLRSDTFTLVSEVAIYGGFSTNMSAFAERDYNSYTSVLSGEIGLATNTDNCYHVITATGVSDWTLDGVTVTRGYAWNSGSDTDPFRDGGGLLMHNTVSVDGSLWIQNCRFIDNSANFHGGAVYLYENATGTSLITISNCTFEANEAWRAGNNAGAGIYLRTLYRPIEIVDCTFADNVAYNGGGIYDEYGDVNVRRCVFRNNEATYAGGGVYHQRTSLTSIRDVVVEECDFIANAARYYGGGMYFGRAYHDGDVIRNCNFYANTTYDYNNSGVYLNLYNGVMEDCIFSGNITTGASGQSGGALYLYHSDTTFRRVIMVGNNTLYGGGAVGMEGLSETRFENVLIAGNKSRYFGGGIYFNNISGLEADFVNCTITDNRTTEANASYGGGGITMYNGALNVTNTIVYGNTSAGAGQQVRLQNTGDEATFGYSDLEGGVAAVHEVPGAVAVDEAGNIDDDPLFETGDSGAWTATGSYDPMTGETVLTDIGATFVPGALVGWYVNPDTSDNFVYYIAANSATTVTIWGDASAIIATDPYEIRSYRLSDISPCAEVGTANGAPAEDLVGFDRPYAQGFDMGAYESTAGFLGTVIHVCVARRGRRVGEKEIGRKN